MAPVQTSSGPRSGPPLGLRERKKIQTRRAIRRAAYRLFEEYGYDATPVDRIAEAADVSPSTVFRYFPAKEDLVLRREHDPLPATAVLARPAGESPMEAVRQGVVEAVRQALESDPAELKQSARIIHDVPALRGRAAEAGTETCRLLAAALAERTGRPPGGLETRVAAAAVLAVINEVLMYWVDQGQPEDLLVPALDHALRTLADGITL
ncbi:TetR/AcrR family transcriptional regulator [Streptomyces sp. NPDC053048]|uniref:TetR/AcrR family transcriptional regulator n=1 Tax=Streptomyces sp. NPDC053048 TaxID=3365694 RepID=UPI0037D764B4